MTIGRFLGGVAALIWDPRTKRYLILRRAAHRDFQAGAWECVTGRVDQGESYEEALYREVQEETGLKVQIEFLIGSTHFYRGDPIPENELLGIIYSCQLSGEKKVEIHEEHSEMRWVSVAEAESLLPKTHWLRRTIQKAERLRMLLPAELRSEYLRDGFNI
jgi:8-oxo-dGTP diphosphatase